MIAVDPSSSNILYTLGAASKRRVSLNTSPDESALLSLPSRAELIDAIGSFEAEVYRCAVDCLTTRQGNVSCERLSEASRDQPLFFKGELVASGSTAIETRRLVFTLADTAVLRRAAGLAVGGPRDSNCRMQPNIHVLDLPWTEKLAVIRRALGPDLRSLCAAMSPKGAADVGLDIPDFGAAFGEASSPASFIQDILSNRLPPRIEHEIAPAGRVHGGPGAFWPLLFLAHLRPLGIVLPPLRTRYLRLWRHPFGRCFASVAFTPAQASIMDSVEGWAGRMTRNNQALTVQAFQSLLLSSDVRGPEDLSVSLATGHLDCILKGRTSRTSNAKIRSLVSVSFNRVLQVWNEANPGQLILDRCAAGNSWDRPRSSPPDRLPPSPKASRRNRKGDPFWFVEDDQQEAAHSSGHQAGDPGRAWATIFRELLPLLKVKCLGGHRSASRHWIRYVDGLDNPPCSIPDVIRVQHINDVLDSSRPTFRRYLAGLALTPNNRNDILGSLSSLFGLYLEAHSRDERLNPVRLDLDRFLGQAMRGKTARTPITPEAMERLKALNQRDNFAFSRSFLPCAHFEGAKARMGHYRRITGPDGMTLTWWPGLAVLLDLMLTLPLRGFQSRWLDSGEGDEFELDLETLVEHPNLLPTAERGREMGAFRLFSRGIGTEERMLGLRIATNKVTIGRDGRFDIPWCPEDLRDALSMLMGWQRQHNPIANPVPADEHPWAPGTRNEEVEALLPRVFPVFRDPARADGRPPSYQQVQTYWNQLCIAVEDEAQDELPGLRLTRRRKRDMGSTVIIERVALYDLHSLRVSGITALIEAGLPPSMVQEIVGHATVLMTLYYYKVSLGTVNSALAAAFAAREQAVEKLIADVKDGEQGIDPLLFNLRAPEDAAGPGMLRSAIGNGSHQVLTHGICPGGDCRTGGDYSHLQKEHGPVPRAGACSVCRYRVTGPMFLAGLVVNANKIMSELHARGQALRELNDAIRARRRQGQASSAFEARREILHRELEDLWTEWAAEHRYVQDSLGMLNKPSAQEAPGGGVALLFGDGAKGEIGVRTERRHAFHLAQLLSEASAHAPSDRHAAAIAERDAFLNEMLANNGIHPASIAWRA